MIKKIFSLLILIALTNACGTDAGNPGIRQEGGQNTDVPCNFSSSPSDKAGLFCMPTPAVQILTYNGLCQNLKRCFAGVAQEECTAAILSDRQLPEYFQLTHLANSGNDLDQLLSQKKIQYNQTQFSQCMNALLNLSCSSTEITSAYKANDPQNFSSASNMMKGVSSCENLFTETK